MTTTEDLLGVSHAFVPRDKPRKEAVLIEDEEVPYQWFVRHDYIDLDVPEASFPYYVALPGPCGNRKAIWLAWELGFAVAHNVGGGGHPD